MNPKFRIGLTPDFYTYTFTVDGVRTIDPKNPMVKPGLAGLDSMFLVIAAYALVAVIVWLAVPAKMLRAAR